MRSQKVAAGRSTPVRLYQSLSRLRESNHRIHVRYLVGSLHYSCGIPYWDTLSSRIRASAAKSPHLLLLDFNDFVLLLF